METYLAQVRKVYPDLVIDSVRPIVGEGQFSIVVIVNEAIVFRFPRSDEVAQAMMRETAILRHIQGRIALPIPNPIYGALNPDTGGQTFMGYPMLAGVPAARNVLDGASDATVQRFAADLAGFLDEMHSIRPSLIDIDLPIQGTRDEWVEMYHAFHDELYRFMRPDAQAQVSATFETALADKTLWDFQPTLIHGDLGTGNILVDPAGDRISGIIDFGMCGLGDPAQDVGAIWSLGDRLMQSLLMLRPDLRNTLRRVEFIRSTYALQQALHALRLGDEADFQDGIQGYI